jgi:hypothetical protein
MVGSKTIEELADEVGMPLADVQQFIARGKIPLPITANEMVEEGNKISPKSPYHARQTTDLEIWFRLFRTKRLRLGYEFYNHPARAGDFIGFDSEDVALYRNH